MRKNPTSQSGIFTLRVFVALALCSCGVLLGMFSLAATTPVETTRAHISVPPDPANFLSTFGSNANRPAAVATLTEEALPPGVPLPLSGLDAPLSELESSPSQKPSRMPLRPGTASGANALGNPGFANQQPAPLSMQQPAASESMPFASGAASDWSIVTSPNTSATQTTSHLSETARARLTLPFISNRGQVDARVAYYASTLAGTVYVTRQGLIVHSLPARGSGKTNLAEADRRPSPGWTLTQRLVTSAALTPQAEGAGAAQANYFLGKDPARWQRNLPTHDRISLGEAWPGIGVSLTAHSDRVETFYTIAPGAEVRRIRVAVSGAERLALHDERLVAQTGLGPVTLSRPQAWQVIHGARRSIPVRYVLQDTNYGFRLGPHDPAVSVVIDPDIQATYLGGSGGDFAYALALDAGGDVYMAGATGSADFPGTTGGAQPTYSGGQNVFVARLNPGLTTLIQATYLGGSGNSNNVAYALALGAGGVYVAGLTTATDFPGTTGGAQPIHGGIFNNDVFVAKLNPALTTLDQATFLGGTVSDAASALALDADGNVYVAGTTRSANFPGTVGGAQPTRAGEADAFVAKLNPGLTILAQATYLGGSGGSVASNAGNALALGAGGDVYMAGMTSATDFPGTAGGAQETFAGGPRDAFVARLDPGLTTLDQATYLGGSGDGEEPANALAIDAGGDVYVAGFTFSTDFPGTAGGAQTTNGGGPDDTFIARLNPGLTTIHQATYLGGSHIDEAHALALGAGGDVYVAGTTYSPNFPGTAGGAQSTTTNGGGLGPNDAFVARLNAGLTTLDQATYLGGSDQDAAHALALTAGGAVYVAGSTYALVSDFPGTTGGAQSTRAGSYDAYAARLPADLKAHVPPSVQLTGVVSRKIHGGAGTFDVDLPLTGPRGIECRSGGSNGDYTMIFTFSNPLTSVGGAATDCGSVSSSAIGPNQNQYTVNLTGENSCNGQYITVTLQNVIDSAGNISSSVSSPPMGLLIGDTNGNGAVNASDISQTKSQSGQTTTGTNFRTDVNVNGVINASDISTVKSRSGTALP